MARIVIVDDETESRSAYRECLLDAGHAVATFEGRREALRHIEEHGCDLLVLDVPMTPGGQDVLRTMKRARPDLPVVVASSHPAHRKGRDSQETPALLDGSPALAELIHIVRAALAGKP